MFLFGTALSFGFLHFEDLFVDTHVCNYSFWWIFPFINTRCLLLFLIMIFAFSLVLIGINIAKAHAAKHVQLANTVLRGRRQHRVQKA